MALYSHPFWTSERTGNNAFAWEIRKNHKLYVPSLMEGVLEDVMEGDEVVFEDLDEHGTLQSCKGLRNLIFLAHPKTQKPIYVVDNHNHVFYCWFEALKKDWIKKGATLVHIDGHRDTRIPERNPSHEELDDLEKLAQYTNTILNVGNYIPPAMAVGLIKKTISVISETEMEMHPPKATENLIVNIDLDFWAPELDYIPRKFKDEFCKQWMQEADLITFATSPFFIDQQRAIEVLKNLLTHVAKTP